MASDGTRGIGIDLGGGTFRVAALDGGKSQLIQQFVVPGPVLTAPGVGGGLVGTHHFQSESIKSNIGMAQRIRVGDQELTQEQVAIRLLAEAKQRCEETMRAVIQAAMIAVPPCFSDRQKAATLDCAKAAGFERVGLIHDPSAAALIYSRDSSARGKWLLYGLGKSAFWVTVVDSANGNITELAHNGDIHLGGDALDALLLDDLIERGPLHSVAQEALHDPAIAFRLISLASAVNKRLSTEDEMSFSGKIEGTSGRTCSVEFSYSRRDFDVLVRPQLTATVQLTEQAIHEAGLRPEQIDRVLLVGGATRAPWIRDRLRLLIPADLEHLPDEAIARGAAIYSTRLGDCFTPKAAPTDLTDLLGAEVSPKPLFSATQKQEKLTAPSPRSGPLEFYRQSLDAQAAQDLPAAIAYYREFLLAGRRELAFVVKQHAARLEGLGRHKDALEVLEDFLNDKGLAAAGDEIIRGKLSDIYYRLACGALDALQTAGRHERREMTKRAKSLLKKAVEHRGDHTEARALLRQLS